MKKLTWWSVTLCSHIQVCVCIQCDGISMDSVVRQPPLFPFMFLDCSMQSELMLGKRYPKVILISAGRHQMISLPYGQTQNAARVVDLPLAHLRGCL